MHNDPRNKLMVYGVGTLVALLILYAIRWYIFSGLVLWAVYHVWQNNRRPG
jgi:type IV secretory pathway TrbD component